MMPDATPPQWTWSTYDQSPALQSAFWQLFEDCWPAYITQGHPAPGVDFVGLVNAWPTLQLMLIDRSGTSPVLAATMAIAPVAWTLPPDSALPDDGWDQAIRDGLRLAKQPTHITAHIGLAATVHVDYRGQGLSSKLLKQAAKQAAGHRLIIPVRPNQKSQHPHLSMAQYLTRTRGSDGLSIDAWLRVHQRLNATILGVCPNAMSMTGTLEEWQRWCGPRQDNGVFAGLLAPLTADRMYVEPNVWVEHQT